MIKKHLLALTALSITLSPSAFSAPASTEYVRNAMNALQSELSNTLNALNNLITTVQGQVNDLPILTYKLGDIAEGGRVFWVDASRQHGLMVSLTDLNEPEGVTWRNGESGDRITNAQAHGLGAGETNTRLIIAEQTIDEQEGRFAALLAGSYQIAGDGTPCAATMRANTPCFSGWYLPSTYELVLLHNSFRRMNLEQLDGFYWSSTEGSPTDAWLVDFATGEPLLREKSTLAQVRAIRAF